MKRSFLFLGTLITLLTSSLVYAQTAPAAPTENPLSAEVKGAYTNIKNNFIKAAEKMPEEHYGFKASAELQSFAQRVAHIADANVRTCAALKGEQKSVNAAAKTTKADMVAVLKESFTYCDAVYDSLTDAEAVKVVSVGRGQRSRLAALWGVVAHSNEVYGTMTVYMRLKGIVPPSSEGR
jgi:uncharacterized damage-inducible protein DinB